MARYIRTVPRFGYAFCGEAKPAPATGVSRPAPSGACIVLGPQEWLLSEGPNLVGRDRDCAIRVDSGTVSRHHLRIVVTRDRATVEDLESRNGTRVNGQRVGQRLTLKDGDEIRIGAVTMTYRVLDGLPSTVAAAGVSDPLNG